MSRSQIIVLSLFILGSVFFLWAILYILPKSSPNEKNGQNQFKKSSSTAKTQNSQKENENTVRLPIPLNEKSVIFASINYNFEGEVSSFVKNSTGYDLVLTHMPPGIKSFSICTTCKSPTPVFQRLSEVLQKIPPQDIKLKSQIVVIMAYDLKNHIWITRQVTIFPRQ